MASKVTETVVVGQPASSDSSAQLLNPLHLACALTQALPSAHWNCTSVLKGVLHVSVPKIAGESHSVLQPCSSDPSSHCGVPLHLPSAVMHCSPLRQRKESQSCCPGLRCCWCDLHTSLDTYDGSTTRSSASQGVHALGAAHP